MALSLSSFSKNFAILALILVQIEKVMSQPLNQYLLEITAPRKDVFFDGLELVYSTSSENNALCQAHPSQPSGVAVLINSLLNI